MELSQSSQDSSWKCKHYKSQLTLGKKRRKHIASGENFDDSQSIASSQGSYSEISTQVTPIKNITIANQTSSSSTSTGTVGSQYDCNTSSVETEIVSPILSNAEALPTGIREMIQNGTLNILCNILQSYDQLEDLRNFLLSLVQGRIPPENICWLLNLHLGKLTSLSSTTEMHWHKDIVEFFSVVYLLFGASAINVHRGPMHFSKLVMENIEKGYFDPSTVRISLPIPSVTTLRSLSTSYTKEIPVGIVEQTLDIAEGGSGKGSQYILSFDGKLVAKGFKCETYSDINLWGIEKPISVDCALKLLKKNITTAEAICHNLKPKKIFHIVQSLHSLLNQISCPIKTLHSRIAEHQLRLKIVCIVHNEALDNKQKYSYRMQLSFLNEHSARCDSAIGRCLQLNGRILKILSHLQKNSDVFSSQKPVELHLQDNAHFLFPPEHLCIYFNLDLPENTDIIKQRSKKWFNVQKKAQVTGSTMYNAFGLSLLGDLKRHHYQFVKKRSPPPFSDEVKKRMKYGQENEKNALVAIIGGLLPAF